MKCDHCGFISKKEFDTCPYCGNKLPKENKNVLHKFINLGKNNSIRTISLIYLVLINVFALSLLIDVILILNGYHLQITFYSYVACFGLLLLSQILYKRKSALAVFEKIDLFIVVGFIIAAIEFVIPNHEIGSPTSIVFTILSCYIIFSTVAFIFLAIFGRGQKFRPILTEYLLILHFLLTLIMFVFYLISVKFDITTFSWMLLDGKISNLQAVLTYASFGMSSFFLVNFNILLIVSIVLKVKYVYGK